MLLALIGKELRKLHSARVALDTGGDKYSLMEQWNMRSDYPARLLLENARRVSRPWCERALRRCFETDRRIMSVSGTDRAAVLTLLLMVLALGGSGQFAGPGAQPLVGCRGKAPAGSRAKPWRAWAEPNILSS